MQWLMASLRKHEGFDKVELALAVWVEAAIKLQMQSETNEVLGMKGARLQGIATIAAFSAHCFG